MFENSDEIILQACRACLNTKATEYVKFADDSLVELYKFCVDIEISDAHETVVLCSKCSNVLKKYSIFKRLCQESEAFWGNFTQKNLTFDTQFETKCDIKTKELANIDSICLENDLSQNTDTAEKSSVHEESIFYIENTHEIPKETIESQTFYGQCANCFKGFYSKTYLRKHVAKCAIDKLYKYDNQGEFNRLPFCGLCKESTDDTNTMNKHILSHYTNSDLKCQLCSFVGSDFAVMLGHRFLHKPRNMKSLKCYCNRVCYSSYSAEFHFRKIHLKSLGGKCRECGKQFDKIIRWKRHEITHGVRKYECAVCGKRFHRRYDLTGHMIYHADSKKYICDWCGRGFYKMYNLKMHISARHTDKKGIKCTHCNKLFKDESYLRRHIRREAGEKHFNCSVCAKQFYSEKELSKHMFWHTDDKPFACEICGQSYKSKGYYNIHKRQHLGVFPHKCDQCDKSFSTKAQVDRHKAVHTGLRKHQCAHCARSFHSRKLLASHSVKQHPDAKKYLASK